MQHPSPNQLRVFEACGRLGSFTKAAEELCITPSAVSHQIRLLEKQLMTQLFIRTNRDVKLTALAQEYWATVSGALATMRQETERLYGSAQRPLLILCARSFLRNWLLPRLTDFYQLYPDAKFEFTTFDKSGDLEPSAFDASIRLGDGQWRGYRADRIVGINLFPISSPRYLASHPPITEPSDLREHVLIHSARRPNDWSAWFEAADLPGLEPGRKIGLDGETLEYQAASAGLGIALGREGFCEADLAEGRLVRLFDITARAEGAYYLVFQSTRLHNTRLKIFRDWLLQ